MPSDTVGVSNAGFVPASDESATSKNRHHSENLQQSTITLDNALELIGLGRIHVALVAICGLTIMAASVELMGIGVVLPAAKCDLTLTSGEQGLVNGATFLGMVSSAYVWGYLCDTRGRRKIIRLALFGCVVCAVASSFANGFATLFILRLLAGVCISAPSSIIFAYLGEFCTPAKRSLIISYGTAATSLAMAYVGSLSWWILSYDWNIEMASNYYFKPWRLLFPLYSLPALVAAVAFQFVPESPKFYAAIGQTDRALEVLQHCYRKNKGSLAGFTHYRLEPVASLRDRKMGLMRSFWKQTVPLLRWPIVLYFAVCCIQKMSGLGVYGGLSVWYPELMNQLMFAGQDIPFCRVVENTQDSKTTETITESVCAAEVHPETFLSMVIFSGFSIVYNALNSLSLRRISEKNMIVFNLLVAAAAGITLLHVSSRYVIVLLFCTEAILALYASQLVNSAVMVLFPTQISAMAVSLSMMVARLSSFMFSSLVGYLIEENCDMTFYIFAGIMIVGASTRVFLP